MKTAGFKDLTFWYVRTMPLWTYGKLGELWKNYIYGGFLLQGVEKMVANRGIAMEVMVDLEKGTDLEDVENN